MKVFKNLWHWFLDRSGVAEVVVPLAKHKVPPDTGWAYVFGSATLMAFILQVLSGIVLATVYVSSTNDAYQSLQYITNIAILGNMVRGIHYFGASAMIILIGIHALQVFMWGAYKYPREMNWLVGALLLLFTLAMAFTGQLLRWDQDALWSVVVGADQASRFPFIGLPIAQFILGGQTLGSETLSHMFAFHVFFIPAIIIGLIGFHLFLVIRNGVSEPPKRGDVIDPKTYKERYERLLKREGIPFWPDAAWRDVIGMVGVIAVVLILAATLGPPNLGRPPDPTIIHADPKPDWYFIWYFAILALIPPASEPYIIIGAPLLLGVVLFLLPVLANKGERSPWRRPWSMMAAVLIVMLIVSFWIVGLIEPWKPRLYVQPLQAQAVNVSASNTTASEGLQLFHDKGCEYCHQINGVGGIRGPDLSHIAGQLTRQELIIRISNGGSNMPAYGSEITKSELTALVDFLETRTGDGGTRLSTSNDLPTPTAPANQAVNK